MLTLPAEIMPATGRFAPVLVSEYGTGSPAISGLFPLFSLPAHHLLSGAPLPIRSAAWYTKS